MSGLLFIVPMLAVAYWVLCRFTGLRPLQRGVAIGVLVVFTELVAAAFWWPGSQVLIRELVWGLLLAYLVGMFGYVREARRRTGGDSGLHGWGIAFVLLFFALILFMNMGLMQVSERGLSSEWQRRVLPEQSSSLAFPGLIRADARPHAEVLRVYLAGLRRLGERGWSLSENWTPAPVIGAPGVLSIRMARRDQAPLSDAVVHVELLGSRDADHDRYIELIEDEPGAYQATVAFSQAGIWGLALRIDADGETLHLLSTIKVARAAQR